MLHPLLDVLVEGKTTLNTLIQNSQNPVTKLSVLPIRQMTLLSNPRKLYLTKKMTMSTHLLLSLFSADSVLSDFTVIPSVSSAHSCSNKKKTRKANTKKAKIKTRANTVSTLANPFSITTGHTLLNYTTRTVTDGFFAIHHKKSAKRKRTSTATSASVARSVHVPHQGNNQFVLYFNKRASLCHIITPHSLV